MLRKERTFEKLIIKNDLKNLRTYSNNMPGTKHSMAHNSTGQNARRLVFLWR